MSARRWKRMSSLFRGSSATPAIPPSHECPVYEEVDVGKGYLKSAEIPEEGSEGIGYYAEISLKERGLRRTAQG